MDRRNRLAQLAGLATAGAGAIHAAAAGIHAEHVTLSRLFVAVAAAQLIAGIVLLVRTGRFPALAVAFVNAGAVGAWLATRMWGMSWIAGLEEAEAPQFADTVSAMLGAIAVLGALVVVRRGDAITRPTFGLAVPASVIGVLTVASMFTAATHVHSHGGSDAAGAEHQHGAAATGTTVHTHDQPADEAHEHPATTVDDTADEVATWPRPWDPTEPIDFSGVEGVTPGQQSRAEALVAATLEQLPQFADPTTLAERGYRSIGDAGTGFEHYVNLEYVLDDSFLDASRPESLVFAADGDTRTLVSAMYISTDLDIDDPELINYGGPLMEWHVHEDLCWSLDDSGQPVIVAVTDDARGCPPLSINAGGGIPMVHVWIAPHECGPFAALEGHGAGQTAGDGARADQCAHDHTANADGDDNDRRGDHADHETVAVAPVPYDPTKPIDLSGVEGVTPEQQAYAENVVAMTVMRLPQWSDPAVAEAAGFRSIGDAATGHEHYIQWEWIDDDVWLDPDAPESLVYEPQPDGSKRLVSAMYMLPHGVALEDVPASGGRLMQWHVHDNLCWTDDPAAPLVRGLTEPDGSCRPPLVKHAEAPMIHVWIVPHECGPFAALEGLGAGSVAEGEERWCDHAHGS